MSDGKTKTVDVRLVPGLTNLVPLANGMTLRVEPFRRNGRVWMRVYDAATGAKIQTVRAGAKEAIGSTILDSTKGR